MRPSRAPGPRSPFSRAVIGQTIGLLVVVGAGLFYAGYRWGLSRGARQAPAVTERAHGGSGTKRDAPAPTGDPHLDPRVVTDTTGNFLENPGFEDGSAGWKWLDWSNDWAPFDIGEGRVASGTKAAHLAVRGEPGGPPTRVFGLVQELAPTAFPTRISGRYYVERWAPGTAKKAYTQVVIIAMQPRGDLPSMQLRYVLEGVTEQPYNMSNARYVFVHRRTQPELERWIDFALDVQGDYRRLWGEVPRDGTPFRVLFEARYDDKPLDGAVTNDVWYDDLFVGLARTSP